VALFLSGQALAALHMTLEVILSTVSLARCGTSWVLANKIGSFLGMNTNTMSTKICLQVERCFTECALVATNVRPMDMVPVIVSIEAYRI
jgi:hypothetical protein